MTINQEPAAVIGAIGTIAKAIVPVLIFSGLVHWDDKMTAAVMFLIGVAVTGLSVIFVRSQTVTLQTANQQVQKGIDSPAGTTVQQVVNETKADQEAGK